jgi:hypothetical protein
MKYFSTNYGTVRIVRDTMEYEMETKGGFYT